MPSKHEQMETVATAVRNLRASPLYDYRVENDYHAVIGEGDVDADILFIGEAPGKQEARRGRPFVGASGRVLDELLEHIDLNREEVYITNVVKDRPPDNRDPRAEEIELYTPFLRRQIELIQPKVIATLGRFAMDYILELFDLPQYGQKISNLHGRPLTAKTEHGPIVVIPLFHPAVALYNRDRRGTLEADFDVLKQFI